MLQGRQRVLVFFAIIYVILFGSVGYFLTMAPGLEVEKVDGKVFVKNFSNHVIKDINVLSREGFVLFQLNELLPNEKKEIPSTVLENISLISVVALFHASVSKDLISAQTSAGSLLKYELAYPQTVLKHYKFSAFLKLCNNGETVSVKISENHVKEFFNESNQSKGVVVENGTCPTIEFEFSPIKAGTTEILFNISSVNFNESVSKSIEIK